MKAATALVLASRLQGVLNDLKRDVPSASRELDLPEVLILAALAGEPEPACRMRAAILEIWPVSEIELAVSEDDTKDGAVLWPDLRARQSSRVIERGGTPYYEYRDTAMSRLSPIRPEWIRALAETDGLDPSSGNLHWNRGHALHQLTYFSGAVDFYYEVGGCRKAQAMEEGDSAFIPSFVPHTFACRDASSSPHILALTFHAHVHAAAREELALLPHLAAIWAGQPESNLAKQLISLCAANSLSIQELLRLSRIAPGAFASLLSGRTEPAPRHVSQLAAALQIRPADLSDHEEAPAAQVVILKAQQGQGAPFPDEDHESYFVSPLARSPLTPRARGLELSVRRPLKSAPIYDLIFDLHQYAYILEGDVTLRWVWDGSPHEASLAHGDSLYLKPGVRHEFVRTKAGSSSRVLSFRSANTLTFDTRRELDQLGPDGRLRYLQAQTAWYR